MQSDSAAAEYIRARQLNSVDQLLPPMLIANVVCGAGLVALQYRQHGRLLLCWLALITVLSGLRHLQAKRAARTPRQSASKRATSRAVVQAIISAIVFTGVPGWLLTVTSGLTLTVVVCHLTGTLWAGALVLATVVPSAIAFVGASVLIIDVGLLVSGFSAEHIYLAALFLAGAATAMRSVFQQSKLFIDSQRQQVDLKRQGDVIGILLKDYEEQTSDWLWETDAQMVCRNPSARFAQAIRRPRDEIEGVVLGELLLDANLTANGEALLALRAHILARRSFRDLVIPFAIAGQPRWWSVSGRPVFDDQDGFAGYRGVSTDITETRLAQARIAHLAHHDALTDLPNRSFFCDGLDRALQKMKGSRLAVISLDLDGFKAVNDRFGHPAGDAVLTAVAERLRGSIGNGDMVARFGGDEFIAFDAKLSEPGEVERLCHHLIELIGQPIAWMGEELTVGVSIGIALAPEDGRGADELLKNADAALYRAKAEGRGTFRFFEPEMDRRRQERQSLLQDLRSALAHGEFALYFQPFVHAQHGNVTGCEALIRWRHPTRGMVSPVDFIPLAEESGLIGAMGAWVIEQACIEAARWPAPMRVSVNISPVQFRDRSLPHIILAALTRASLSPSRLEVEVTETVLIDDPEAAIDLLRQIKALGVTIALDDFGTGYSSLSYLRRFPFDKVKIDRSFVQELSAGRNSQVIVRAIRDLARGLGMTITAEGVETGEQASQLRQTGCDELQGFLFSKPRPSDQLPQILGDLSWSPATIPEGEASLVGNGSGAAYRGPPAVSAVADHQSTTTLVPTRARL